VEVIPTILDLAADALLRLSDTCRWLAVAMRVTP
jgi:hypothetical protein